jgi:hypothetical protein
MMFDAVDYAVSGSNGVSCSPLRVPLARLITAQMVLRKFECDVRLVNEDARIAINLCTD